MPYTIYVQDEEERVERKTFWMIFSKRIPIIVQVWANWEKVIVKSQSHIVQYLLDFYEFTELTV